MKSSSIAILGVLLIAICASALFAYHNPRTCAVRDPVNLNPTRCTCLGYERVTVAGVVGGHDSLCYGFILSKSKEY